MNKIIPKLKKKATIILNSSKEINSKEKNKKYYTVVGDNKENIKLMIEYMKIFIKLTEPKYLG